MKWLQARKAPRVDAVCAGTSMLSPWWPGRWNGSDIATPWARMHRAKSMKSRSPWLCVSDAEDWADAPAWPGRLATDGLSVPVEQAPATTPATISEARTADHPSTDRPLAHDRRLPLISAP